MGIRRMQISPEVLMCIGSGTFQVIGNPIPQDAQLRQATIDPLNGCITLFIESEEFSVIHVGQVVPVIEAPIISRQEF